MSLFKMQSKDALRGKMRMTFMAYQPMYLSHMQFVPSQIVKPDRIPMTGRLCARYRPIVVSRSVSGTVSQRERYPVAPMRVAFDHMSSPSDCDMGRFWVSIRHICSESSQAMRVQQMLLHGNRISFGLWWTDWPSSSFVGVRFS